MMRNATVGASIVWSQQIAGRLLQFVAARSVLDIWQHFTTDCSSYKCCSSRLPCAADCMPWQAYCVSKSQTEGNKDISVV